MPAEHPSRTLSALLISACCGPAAAAQFDCIDERGVHHRMPHNIQTELIHFQCVEVSGSDAASPTTRRPIEARRYSSVMLTEGQAEPPPPPQVDWPVGQRAQATQRLPSSPSLPAALKGSLDALIHSTALEFGHDPDLLRAIVKVESGFNARALSPKGAMGLMQLMPATARRFGVADKTTLFMPGVNLQAGARYLAYLKQLFPRNLELAIAAYNAGEGAVIQRNYRIPPFPETQSYVQQVLAAYRHFRSERGLRGSG